ncbi:MAG: DUF5121 domain-containing protein [Bacteroidales bacterium]|nr:DUF5121 domain-containing protein [Bacteroidales bacterium]
MKKSIKYIAAFAALALAFSCTKNLPVANQKDLPEASKLTPDLIIDQETNYVTFSIKEKGVVPIWIFEDTVDDKDGVKQKKYVYAQNGITLRLRDAGVHRVELRAYNASGVSVGAKIVEFELENTYRDPFNPEPYMKALANTWAWDADNDNHFGCGPNLENPTQWWSAKAHEKDGFGLYDDTMTFTADGQFTHNPGEGGTIYVNYGSGFKPEGHEEEIANEKDYQVEVEETSSAYTIENNWNSAGVEEVYLVLAPGQYLTYLPNGEALTTNTRYMFQTGMTTAQIKKNPVLFWNNGGIVWKYSFVPHVHKASAMELLAGTDSKGKVWVMDFDAPGHLACGPSLEDPIQWWSASPGDKSDTGLFDNEYTFYPDGTYEFNVGPDGVTYVNKGFTATGEPEAAEDYDLAWESFKTTFDFDEEVITFPETKIFGYIPNNAAYEHPHYVVKEITETKLVLVCDSDPGIGWQYIFKARDIVGPSQTINGVGFEGGKADLSFTKGEAVTVEGIELGYIDPDFFAGEAGSMTFAAESGDYRVYNMDGFLKVVPMSGNDPATWSDGKALWLIGTGFMKPDTAKEPDWSEGADKDIPFAKDGKNYQATIYVTGPNFKVFGQAGWGMELGGDSYTVVEANDYFKINGFPSGAEKDNGNIWSGDAFAEGWYVIKLVDNGDGTFQFYADKKKDTYYDIEGETNLWRKATLNPNLYYTGESWDGALTSLVTPEISANNDYTVTIPEGIGNAEWKGQNKIRTGIHVEAGVAHDCCFTLVADEDMTVVVKITGWNPDKKKENGDPDPNDDDMFAMFYKENVELIADEPLTIKLPKLTMENTCDDFCFITDYGRSPAGSTITLKDVCFQKHLEK